MGRYAITAQFQPFSFQERIAPLQIYKQEYDIVNEGLAALGENANAYAQYIDPNSQAGKALAEYNNQLSQVANDLSANGLKAVSRNTLYNLRRQYNSNIKQINGAAQNLATMYDQYRALSMKDPSLMIGKMPSVDELIANPNARPYMISGNDLYNQSASLGQSSQINSEEDLNAYIQQVAQSNGIENLGDQSQALSLIKQGLLAGRNARIAKIQEKQADLEMKDYYDQLKQARSYKYNNSLIWNRAAAQKSVNTHKASLSSSTRAIKTSSGVRYMKYPKGTWRVQGDNQYFYDGDYGARSDTAKKAIENTKATNVRFEDLTPENKLRALDYLGIDRPSDIRNIDSYTEELLPYLNEFTYAQYIPQKKREDAEFVITSRTIGRDTAGNSISDNIIDTSEEDANAVVSDYIG